MRTAAYERRHGAGMSEPLQRLIGETVVLDTGTPIVYVGKLIEVGDHTFLLESADMHDCRDGHATQEAYIAELREAGVAVNRRRIVVMRTAVISVSRLDDVVTD